MTMRDLRRNYRMKAFGAGGFGCASGQPISQVVRRSSGCFAARLVGTKRHDAVYLRSGSPANHFAHRLAQASGRTRLYVLHQLRVGQGHTAQPTSASQPCVLLAAHGAASSRAGASIEDRSRDQRTLLPLATSHQSIGRRRQSAIERDRKSASVGSRSGAAGCSL